MNTNDRLFYDDDSEFFDITRLRGVARDGVASNSLMRRAASGEKAAAVALHVGFWPFVREFEIAIDRQRMPRGPLRMRFNAAGSGHINGIFRNLAAAVATMRMEEGSHAAHWRKDAAALGVPALDAPVIPAVQALIDTSYTKNLPRFFSVLAGTEFVAEEIAAFLTRHTSFTSLFSRNRWVWGDVHLIPHDDGPSHLDIDLDLARAYSEDDVTARTTIPNLVVDTIGLFDRAACEVEAVHISP